MSKRVAEDEEWDLRKDKILRLYQVENRPLPKVIDHMAEEARFKRSKAQYERAFKRWGIKKNAKASDWQYVASRLGSRRHQHAPCTIEVGGKFVSEAKAKKEVARYTYQTTMQRLQSEYRQRNGSLVPLIDASRSIPHLLQERNAERQNVRIWEPDSPVQRKAIYWTNEQMFQLAKKTPWPQFICFINSLGTSGPPLLLPPADVSAIRAKTNQLKHLSSDPNLEISSVSLFQSTPFQEFSDGFLLSTYTTETDLCVPHKSVFDPKPYLPPTCSIPSDIDVNSVLDLSTRSNQLEFLKYIVHVVGNNFASRNICDTVVDLCQSELNRGLLKNLLDQKLLMVKALGEKLVIAASRGNNIPLVKILLDAGCDVNIHEEKKFQALHEAIFCGHEEMASFLLHRGAYDDKEVLRVSIDRGCPWPIWNQSSLDYAVEAESLPIIKELLKHHSQFIHRPLEITVHTLSIALSKKNIELFHFLLDQSPQLVNEIRSKPWSILEYSAWCGILALPIITKYSFDINKTDEQGKGSMLAVATACDDIDLVRHLLKLGADVRGIPTLGIRWNWETPRLRPCIADIELTALQWAIKNGNREMVDFLLSKGADANQTCHRIFPIQLAASLGDKEIVTSLLKAGACPNAVKTRVKKSYEGIFWLVGQSPALIALEKGNELIFDLLVQYGGIPQLSCSHKKNWSSIRSAITGGNRQLIKRVSDQSSIASYNLQRTIAECMLLCSSIFAREIFKIPPIDLSDPNHALLLRTAVYCHDMEYIIQLLTAARSSLGQYFPYYMTEGLTAAVEIREESLINMFLEAGASPTHTVMSYVNRFHGKFHRTQGFGRTNPLNQALTPFEGTRILRRNLCFKSKMPVDSQIALLLEEVEKPKPDKCHHDAWRTYIIDACMCAIENSNLRGLESLVAKGLELDWVPAEGFSFLQYALKYQRMEIAEFLIQAKVNLNVAAASYFDLTIHTALQCVIRQDNTVTTRNILDMGACVHAKPGMDCGATALQFAAINGNFEILKLLLERGADVNEPPGDFEGRTSIEGAAEHGRLNMAMYLLELGADIRGRASRNYRRTLYRAWRNGHRALVEMIQDWKSRTYGPEDCENIDIINETMTKDELDFAGSDAKQRYQKFEQEREEKRDKEWQKYDTSKEREEAGLRKLHEERMASIAMGVDHGFS
ncbi:ankyrin [Corynespora cassiicola Philippines]|uniref:Ankyrin n=1 Tax=Corynespora cassiicola Philippines TaxID=1448308 RepID=A0A2T2NX49_CORCC|nr:ankyrin [Corynespora cassiicola Philippines]